MTKLTSSSYTTSQWSGGETTELVIFPQGSSFKDKEFQYRLSIATIRISSSDFTPLPGVDRTLLLLEGELKLIHEGHHESFLMPFSQDKFKGDWNTHSVGIAKDFNLMTMNDTKGIITVISHDFSYSSSANHIIFYCHEGEGTINNIEIKENELIIQENSTPVDIQIDGKIIMIEITFSA